MSNTPWPRFQPLPSQAFADNPDRACVEADTDLFFHDHHAAPALAICRRCPVIRECFIWAYTTRQEGVWGGTTSTQREALRRRRRRAAEVAA